MIASTPCEQSSPATSRGNPAFLWLACVAAALGGLLFGYDWVVIGGAAKFYEAHFQLADSALTTGTGTAWERILASLVSPVGWAQSCALLGCLVGALMAGSASDRYGRKPILVVAAANFLVSSLGIAVASSFSGFVAWRILGGLSIGLASNISPLYISEIAPAGRRGLLVAVNQLTIVLGVLAAQLANWLIARPVDPAAGLEAFRASWNVTTGWRWMFASCAAPSLLFLISSLLVPESPRWLAKRGRSKEALKVLTRVSGAAAAIESLREIDDTLSREAANQNRARLLDRRLLGVLLIGITLAVLQQWCGINVVFNYAGEIFSKAGYDLNDTLTNIVMTGLVNLVFTIVAMATVDRLGRKPLMLFGTGSLAFVYLLLGGAYLAKASGVALPNSAFLVLVLAAIACYAMSLAPVTWVLISEIFPNRIRGAAMSVAVAALWLACFLLTYSFPILNSLLGAAMTFWIYALICLCGLAFVWLRLPETKGRSLEEIERSLGCDEPDSR